MKQESEISDQRVSELLHKYLPDTFLEEIGDLEATIDQSALSRREYLCYVFSEVTDKTGSESAEIIGISEGTYWGKMARVKKKIQSAESTIVLTNVT